MNRSARVEVVSVEDLAGQRWAVVGAASEVLAILTPDMDVLDLFEDLRRQPLPQLPRGATVYRRPQMAEEGVPANAEAV